jgi:hypothetical protein
LACGKRKPKRSPPIFELEEAFVKVAASWAKRTGISAAALREVGVPGSVLRRAGLM